MKLNLIFAIIISLHTAVYSQSANELFEDIDFQQDYLKFTKISKPGKFLIEQCNPISSLKKVKNSDGSKTRVAIHSKKSRFQCKPLTLDAKNSCFDFAPKSEIEKDAGKTATSATLTGFVFPPFWILAVREENTRVIFESIRNTITPHSESEDLVLIMGVSASKPDLLRLNFLDKNMQISQSMDINSYTEPGKISWLYDEENKFVRRFKENLTKPRLKEPAVKDELGNVIKEAVYIKPDLSCK
jgi:hypothetical protein